MSENNSSAVCCETEKCVECGKSGFQNVGTAQNPLCANCYARIEKEHKSTSNDSAGKIITEDPKTKNKLIEAKTRFISGIVGAILMTAMYLWLLSEDIVSLNGGQNMFFIAIIAIFAWVGIAGYNAMNKIKR